MPSILKKVFTLKETESLKISQISDCNSMRKISVVGLGYVGLPVAVAFSKLSRVIGFDIKESRISRLQAGFDDTNEISNAELKSSNILFTSDLQELRHADFHIVAVPTPVDNAHQPDLYPIVSASEVVGKILKKGDIVVYESTVYPGVTEEVCLPILEKFSKLKCGIDFKIGYSPERINPGDKDHTFTKILKIVSGQDEEALNIIADAYSSVVTAGVFRAKSIKVAEAAKVIENTQRDLNIALINELAIIFNLLNIETKDVLDAAGTKWNFLKFQPGLVGGHCIGVDPYYLTYKSEILGHKPEVILAGRRINDTMGKYVANKTIKEMIKLGQNVNESVVTILGLTFKENCPDLRNTKVIDIINELKEYGVSVQVHDPKAEKVDAEKYYGIKLLNYDELKKASTVILAVPHQEYLSWKFEKFASLLDKKPLLIDLKSVLDKSEFEKNKIKVWRL
jgi:UDP-N-acetyl-D-galactosamine dehydrogenase